MRVSFIWPMNWPSFSLLGCTLGEGVVRGVCVCGGGGGGGWVVKFSTPVPTFSVRK